MCLTPVTLPGGMPVTAEPGDNPRLPVITLGPVFVIVDPARTVKLRAVPSLGWVAANAVAGQTPATTAAIRTSSEARRLVIPRGMRHLRLGWTNDSTECSCEGR